jgi:hypothetical protein
MEYIFGIVLASLTASAANLLSHNGQKIFYPCALIVVGVGYIGLTLFINHTFEFGWEVILALLFTALAVFGYYRSLWLIVVGLMLHGVYDLAHIDFLQLVVSQSDGSPQWWPAFSYAYDMTLALWLVWYLKRVESWLKIENEKLT